MKIEAKFIFKYVVVDKKNIFKKLVEDQNIRPTNGFFEATVVSELKAHLAAEEDLKYAFFILYNDRNRSTHTVISKWKNSATTITKISSKYLNALQYLHVYSLCPSFTFLNVCFHFVL